MSKHQPLPQLDLGPYFSDSHIKGARYQIIQPSGVPFVVSIVAEVPDLEVARAIIARANAYPKLVEALRHLLDTNCATCPTAEAITEARALARHVLRKLGEQS